MIKVSICIVCYNQENFIETTVLSCLNQTYLGEIEIIISDDFSQDSTPSVLTNLQVKYPQLKVHLHNKNLGITGNSARSIKYSSGELIALCAGDDILYPTKIEMQVRAFQKNPKLVFCYHFSHLYKDGQVCAVLGDRKKDLVKNFFDVLSRTGASIPAPSLMVTRSSIPEYIYHPEIPTASDWLFQAECASKGDVVRLCHVLSAYRLHDNNIGRSFSKYMNDYFLTEKIVYEKFPDLKSRRAVKDGVMRMLLGTIYRSHVDGDTILLDRSLAEYKRRANKLKYIAVYVFINLPYTKCLMNKMKVVLKKYV